MLTTVRENLKITREGVAEIRSPLLHKHLNVSVIAFFDTAFSKNKSNDYRLNPIPQEFHELS